MLRAWHRMAVIAGFAVAAGVAARAATDGPRSDDRVQLVVMDPLAEKLACDCVQGYAQRKYEKLASHLSRRLGRPVQVTWSETLAGALKETGGRADCVIGKDSVVRAEAVELGRAVDPVARLTGRDGSTTQRGWIVVRRDDPAESPADLKGYRIFLGPASNDEKHAAAAELLTEAGVTLPDPREVCTACSESATKLIALPAEERAAAVISSYAAPLLEGCGTVPRDALRVVGQTRDVPFITAFVDRGLDAALRDTITKGLLEAGDEADLLLALETDSGFIDYNSASPPAESATNGASAANAGAKKN